MAGMTSAKTAFGILSTGHWVLVCLLALVTGLAQAQAPTAEQLRRLEQLDPAQRAALSRALEKEQRQTRKEQPLSEPVLVAPLPDRGGHPEDEDAKAERPAKQTAEPKFTALEPFGYDLFSGVPTTFAPATDIPISADYIIGPGDTVQIQLFGKEPAEYNLVVTREGELQFPNIGPISVAGMTFEEMKAALEARVEEQLIGARATISMGQLRSIRVFILGDAARPGSYTVSALSTMTNALFVSGGVKPIGSLRNIQLKRRGEVVTHLDLYDLLLRGDTSGDVRLQPGDVIFIPPIGTTVGAGGEVRRPAIYEMRREKSAEEVLALAGGLLPTAYPQAAQIERITERGERTLIDLDLGSRTGRQTAIRAGDVLQVPSILEKMEDIVLLSGHVPRPGGYQWRPGMRVSDLVPSISDAVLPRPDLDYALIKRERLPERRLELLSVRLGKALQNPASAENIDLQPRDELIVFGSSEDRELLIQPLIEALRETASFQAPAQVVKIAGLVRQPGEYPLESGMRISDLIRAGGGLAEAAYALGAELTRYAVIDGSYREVDHVAVDLAAIRQGQTVADLSLQTRDHLQIKRLPAWAAADSVEIRGEVRFPGVYPIARGEQLSHVLERAGGLTDMAFPEGALFVRDELRKRERERLDELSRRLEMDLASLALKLAQEDAAQSQALDITRGLADQLRTMEPTGRLVIDLPKLLTSTRGGRRSDHDVNLMSGDKLYIPPLTQEVTVTGEVFYPTSHLYKKGLDSESYVNMSGGSTQKADRKRIYVVRADGSVLPGQKLSGNWFQNGDDGEIRPGDTIVVPLDVERVRPISRWAEVSQIIYQLAIAAASAKAVGVF